MATLNINQTWKIVVSHLEKMLNEQYPKYKFTLSAYQTIRNDLAISFSATRQIDVSISGLRGFSLTVTDEFIHDTVEFPACIYVLFEECCELADEHIASIEAPELILGSFDGELDN